MSLKSTTPVSIARMDFYRLCGSSVVLWEGGVAAVDGWALLVLLEMLRDEGK